jgi:hypothetical protein
MVKYKENNRVGGRQTALIYYSEQLLTAVHIQLNLYSGLSALKREIQASKALALGDSLKGAIRSQIVQAQSLTIVQVDAMRRGTR